MTSQNDKNSPLDRLEDYSDLPGEPFRLASDNAGLRLAVAVRSRGVAGEERLARTESNILGEFHLEYEPQRLMNFYLPPADHKLI